jgi:hypothetical protein
MDDDFHALGFDGLLDALDTATSEVVATGFHDQAENANDW